MIRLMDCTLRDGANVVGKGFDKDLTNMMLRGLIENGVRIIEYGNALGIGAYANGSAAPLDDDEYLALAAPWRGRAELGMFMGWRNESADIVRKAADGGLSFLRVGANAGESNRALKAVRHIKDAGLTCRFSMMKAYVLPPETLVREAKALEDEGADEVTIMDSAGTMRPKETADYVRALKAALRIPVAFHGHNNLGMASANAMAAQEAGADVLDCGLMGMARSAGNIQTELIAMQLWNMGLLEPGIDLWGLLTFVDKELSPAMTTYGYRAPLTPLDMTLGLAGAHSSFLPLFRRVADEENVSLTRLILETSRIDRSAPSETLMRECAKELIA